ncbi:MAG: NADH-quinone oxidoreductase subunit N [Polyangiaceae bacterium]|jgi:NADH-quinone oxidoreductase subunit N|nr:NADH-quinone oxidoreductase subunit N [Polyangiaceae bacterium]
MGVYIALSPLLILVLGGCGLMLAEAFGRFSEDGGDEGPSSELSLGSAVCLLAAALMAMGLWIKGPETIEGFQKVAPYLILDRFTLFFTMVTCLGGALASLLAGGYLPEHKLDRGEFYSLLMFSTIGCVVLAASGDLLSLFLGLETMSLGVYALTGFRRGSTRSTEAALKYFLLGSFAAALLLYGGALLYGATGHTDLVGIGKALAADQGLPWPMVIFGFAMILVGLAFKVSAVPFHMWAPDAYEGAPTPAMTFMAVAVKSAAFAMMLRLLVHSFSSPGFTSWGSGWPPVLAFLAVLSMTVANLVAGRQESVKRMLAYSSVAHAGYVLVGVVSMTRLGDEAQASVLLYLLAYTVSTAGALGSLILIGSRGAEAVSYEDLAGIGRRHPAAALAMSFFLLSLAGVPPSAGFFAKMYVFRGAIGAGYYWLAIIGLLNSVLGAYYYLRVMVYMYMREPAPGAPVAVPMRSGLVTAALVLSALFVIVLGVLPGSGLSMALQAVARG